ncbi:tRNA dihydrouridine synthase DusB [Marinospirillum minutulum]|uniref:tRNA dihydrouridine synthase DusB n=1 Tax=Marinospirillum minutulum TaxID=64974 RepID=UPI001B7F7F8D|nr:tRNA dihydrouridine synthase DusB [Marinospirillum minutulum]
MQIGRYKITTPLVLAPMAGVTDRPFRALCRSFGAGLTVAEMVTSDQSLWNTQKSRLRLPHADEPEPRMIQIAGGDPQMLAAAAQANVKLGAQIIDINMGCPAKKVCKKAAGSALLRDEKLVAEILAAVVAAVDVPVTLKIRTGWSANHKNAVTIAQLAEQEGIQALTVHGRTREDRFKGEAEYDTLAEVCQAVSFPVIANGDINSPQKAKEVLDKTGATAVMIGRAAQGKPWIFSQIKSWLENQQLIPDPEPIEIHSIISQHLKGLYLTYGDFMGTRVARKHFGWYLQQAGMNEWRKTFNQLETTHEQQALLDSIFLKEAPTAFGPN